MGNCYTREHRILCNLFVGESFNQSARENVNNYNGQARIIEAARGDGKRSNS